MYPKGGSSGLPTGREHRSGGPVSGPPRPLRSSPHPQLGLYPAYTLEELVQGAPELVALPRHGQHLIATLHGALKAPDAVPPGNPLLPGARRLAALLG